MMKRRPMLEFRFVGLRIWSEIRKNKVLAVRCLQIRERIAIPLHSFTWLYAGVLWFAYDAWFPVV